MTEIDSSTPENDDAAAKPAEPTENKAVPAAPQEEEVNVPELVVLAEMQKRPLPELYELGNELRVRVSSRTKHQIIFDVLCFYSKRGTVIEAEGVIELKNENSFGMLRTPSSSFRAQPDDIYVPAQTVREFGLRHGQQVKVQARAPRDREKYLSASRVLEVEGLPAEDYQAATPFEHLTAMYPDRRIILENSELKNAACRAVDLIAPLGMGQRGVIVAPPRGGKTILLKSIASAIHANHPDVELVILLLDERPEEVTDFRETVNASVFSSTFDENPKRHIEVAEFVLERAKRLVERGKDVVILLDSLTRLARGYNALASGGGGSMSGGLNSKALQKARTFFNSARNAEEGGSLTILATALVETESKMDDIIFEEFKGTGNMEIRLDREMAERRLFPAIHFAQSATRKDDLLYHPDEMRRINVARRQLAQLPAPDAMQVLLKNIARTQNNTELLLTGLQLR
ncbi:transcription termination factor Rho [Sulfuriroseicoccus oceanibius]|uniref:Transcription termination factor Rho n=1 Tax=Sulfuriroseicoccus oceanibius TaxID=2707525 RepID=A0A7T7F0N9_9BACT|nr:transcription termination factor Rho [Sulfuriroseicoccus oceanibius]QQL44512.1 transcription termination factor Rho [Sulfuriroseicoccus oceanibius]